MRIVIVGGLAALVLASTALDATADIGPPEPARKACAGLSEGAACTLDGKAGTCHGPHPSRMYCQPGQPPSQGSGSAAAGSGNAGPLVSSGTGSAAAGSAQPSDPGNAEPAPTPGHKRGCAVAAPGSAALVGLVVAALALRRRRSRSMS
jgi:MYXO-CTERM domain-containing protein